MSTRRPATGDRLGVLAASALLLAMATAGPASASPLVPLTQGRTLYAKFTDRTGQPTVCIPGLCIPGDVVVVDVVEEQATAPDFGDQDAELQAVTARVAATSRIRSDGIEFAAHVSGSTGVPDYSESHFDLSVRFELDRRSDVILAGTLQRLLPPIVSGNSSATVWLLDGDGAELASFAHPTELCPLPYPDETCEPLEYSLATELSPGVYELAALLEGTSSYYARFDLPGAFEARFDGHLRVLPEPGARGLAAAGLALAALGRRARRSSARGHALQSSQKS